MSFTRIDKTAGGPPDALDRALEMDAEELGERPPNARIAAAASVIRHFSAVAKAGGSVEAQAAAVFVRQLSDRIDANKLEEIYERVGARTGELVRATCDDPNDGATLAQRVLARLSRISTRQDADARLLLEVVSEREAMWLRNGRRWGDAEQERDMLAALAAIAGAVDVDRRLASLIRRQIRRVERARRAGVTVGALSTLSADPEVRAWGHCGWERDGSRPHLSWHADPAALLDEMAERATTNDGSEESRQRQWEIEQTAEAWWRGDLTLHDLHEIVVCLDPLKLEWIGPFEEVRSGDSDFARDLRAWYWDDPADDKHDAIPDERLEDFSRVIWHYGEM